MTLQARCSFDDRLSAVFCQCRKRSLIRSSVVVFSVDLLFRDLGMFHLLALQPFVACYCFSYLLNAVPFADVLSVDILEPHFFFNFRLFVEPLLEQ